MSTRVHRITLFKLPDPESQKKLLDAYSELARAQSKVRPEALTPPYSPFP